MAYVLVVEQSGRERADAWLADNAARLDPLPDPLAEWAWGADPESVAAADAFGSMLGGES